jgi:mRNA-degrading endonuclease toxin of MazEF toxin-antitoxin module
MPAAIYNQGDIYFCDPDPQVKDTVGSEQKGDHVWVVVSTARCHRGNCVVGVPLSRHMNKAGGHLIRIPNALINIETKDPNIDRVALVDQIRVLDKTRLRRKVGTLSKGGMSGVFQGLDALFGRTVITRAVSTTPAATKPTQTPQEAASAPSAKSSPTSNPTVIPGTRPANA